MGAAQKVFSSSVGGRALIKTRSKNPFSLIKGSINSKKVSRQFPLLAALHKATDGVLIGALCAVTTMSILTLHWQSLWTVSFSRLEETRKLNNKFSSSIAMLERYLLSEIIYPSSLVATKASDIIYLETPFKVENSRNNIIYKKDKFSFIDIFSFSANHGY
tara:strand:+ start:2447 stop:2929 length:483 start_codon:yes stop_codon:yes gene_type:complete